MRVTSSFGLSLLTLNSVDCQTTVVRTADKIDFHLLAGNEKPTVYFHVKSAVISLFKELLQISNNKCACGISV